MTKYRVALDGEGPYRDNMGKPQSAAEDSSRASAYSARRHFSMIEHPKIAMFTDIHFGKKNNSIQHNQDCLDFVTWFCENAKKERASHVMFLGDWFENRNAVNVLTLHFAQEACRLLNDLEIPVYIIIGNHDLYHRENRKVFSTKVFEEFKNITMVSEPTVVEDKFLVAPYLFKNEYPELIKYNHLPYWFGHFEFRNFVITGSDRRMEHGPDHSQFTGPSHIFSGHFHKRQANDNVVYIGNTFPMDYGDAWDDERGMCVLDTATGDVEFTNWEDCPKYRKVKLSDVLSGEVDFSAMTKCRVRCMVDIDIAYSDAQALKEEMVKSTGLREFSLEENLLERKDAIEGNDEELQLDFSSLNDAVVSMLKTGVNGTATIDPEKLVEIYTSL
jgi:DNA repair exonuclease SbcCD nuclease subunit